MKSISYRKIESKGTSYDRESIKSGSFFSFKVIKKLEKNAYIIMINSRQLQLKSKVTLNINQFYRAEFRSVNANIGDKVVHVIDSSILFDDKNIKSKISFGLKPVIAKDEFLIYGYKLFDQATVRTIQLLLPFLGRSISRSLYNKSFRKVKLIKIKNGHYWMIRKIEFEVDSLAINGCIKSLLDTETGKISYSIFSFIDVRLDFYVNNKIVKLYSDLIIKKEFLDNINTQLALIGYSFYHYSRMNWNGYYDLSQINFHSINTLI
ncbi:hypothetical protein [Spirochaeta cellobiosiphila]|uniref:hypothetical protein n=1 Tax=Spirochaeta cellobiosiphila TaxID=504483 RepID=UPI00040471BC|nr:hypothetical protein [Spirochaeta cellobiosiphila]